MQKFLFSYFIITTLFFVVHSQNDSNITLATTTKTNTTIVISSNSIKIIVKCRDTNSLLTNINLDNSGSMTMSNTEIDENTMDSPILIMFDTCRSRTNNLLSLFKSFSSNMVNNDSQINFSGMSFSNNFHMKIDDETQDEQMPGNETTTMT